MTDETEVIPAQSGDLAAAPQRTAKPRKPGGVRRFLRDIVLIILAALVISFLIKTFFIRSFYIPSPSMENTLLINDRVIVSLLTPGLTPLKNGDVVVFEDPGGWLDNETTPTTSVGQSGINDVLSFLGLAAPDDNDHLIKRVIGLPGDKVKCCDAQGHLIVNGVSLKEPYIVVPKGDSASPTTFSITVPKGDLWVMGDNRYQSADSAYHYHNHDATAFVPISEVTGRAMLISWPASRWTYLSDYPDVFSGVAQGK